MLLSVHNKSVVYLIREKYKPMLRCKSSYLPQQFNRVKRTGRIIRIYYDNGFRPVVNLLFYVIDIRIPIGLLITYIVNCLSARERNTRRPKRIIRRWNKNFIAVVKQCLHTKIYKLAHTVSGINIFYADALYAFKLSVLHYGFSCGEQTLRIGISLRHAHVRHHILYDLIRRGKAERIRISDVEL